jgi:nicotinamidase/pyrazinamidase
MISEANESALVVIDVQNDFCPGGRLPVEEGDRVVPVINRIMASFLRIVGTQDWHPQDHISFASNHKNKNPFDTVEVNGTEQVLWPEHCVIGSDGADFHPMLDTDRFSLVLRKGSNKRIDSYSAFFENDRKTSTGLSFYLKGLGIHRVYLCGLAADICVFYSAMDAVGEGFDTIFVLDATRGVDVPEGNIQKTKRMMEKEGVKIIGSSDIL